MMKNGKENRIRGKEFSEVCIIVRKEGGDEAEEAKDLDARDWDEDDVLGMMTEAELEAYDYLDQVSLGGDRENPLIDDDDIEFIIGTVASFKGTVATFLYAVNSGIDKNSSLVKDCEAEVMRKIEWMKLIAKKYSYIEEIAAQSEKMSKADHDYADAKFTLDGLRDSLDGVDDQICRYLIDNGYYCHYGSATEEDNEEDDRR